MEQSRTLLTEYAPQKEKTPLEERSFSVIANRLVAMGGFRCNKVEVRRIDDHYILMSANGVNELNWEPFGRVDLNKPNIALNRMYEEAKRLAKKRAKFDSNRILDLTSKGKKISERDRCYI